MSKEQSDQFDDDDETLKSEEHIQAEESFEKQLERYNAEAHVMKEALLELIASRWDEWMREGFFRSEHPILFAGKSIECESKYLVNAMHFTMRMIEAAKHDDGELSSEMKELLFRTELRSSRKQFGMYVGRSERKYDLDSNEAARWQELGRGHLGEAKKSSKL